MQSARDVCVCVYREDFASDAFVAVKCGDLCRHMAACAWMARAASFVEYRGECMHTAVRVAGGLGVVPLCREPQAISPITIAPLCS